MAWLRFGLPLHEELEVETHARAIRTCNDVEHLQEFAEQVFRAWVQQSDVAAQLIREVAELEAKLNAAGLAPPLDPEYLEWARACYPDELRSGHS